MKVTFVEEIEARHAWREKMYCSRCTSGKYNIHHQLQPEIGNCWWLECAECKYESKSAPTRALAIKQWIKGEIV